MKYFACPANRQACGMDTFHVPDTNGTITTIEPVNNFGLIYKRGELCRYRVIFPQNAADFDEINVKLTKAIRVKVYATEAESYFSDAYEQDVEMLEEEEINITFPNELFISVISSNSPTAAGNFQFEVTFIDKIVEEVLETMTEEEKAIYFDKKVIKDEKDVTEDSRFWVIVLSTVFTLYIVACLLSMFCRVKRANQEIVSKVEVINGDKPISLQKPGSPENVLEMGGVLQSPGKATIDPSMDHAIHDVTKAPTRPMIDDGDDDMKGFKKASKSLTAYGKE